MPDHVNVWYKYFFLIYCIYSIIDFYCITLLRYNQMGVPWMHIVSFGSTYQSIIEVFILMRSSCFLCLHLSFGCDVIPDLFKFIFMFKYIFIYFRPNKKKRKLQIHVLFVKTPLYNSLCLLFFKSSNIVFMHT